MELGFFYFDADAPRRSFADLRSGHGLFSDGVAPLGAYVSADTGGPMNFTAEFTPETPVFSEAIRAAKDFMVRGKHPGAPAATAGTAQEQFAAQEGDDAACDLCARVSSGLHECCVCSAECCGECCSTMQTPTTAEAAGTTRWLCKWCTDADGAEAEEEEARAEARERGDETSFDLGADLDMDE